jgi:hypothetical protein
VSWLQKRLALNDASLSKLVQRLSRVLGYSAKENLEPKLSWLQERLSSDHESLSKLVQITLLLLGLNVKDNLGPKLTWLQERLDMNNKNLTEEATSIEFQCHRQPQANADWFEEQLSLEEKSQQASTKATFDTWFECQG